VSWPGFLYTPELRSRSRIISAAALRVHSLRFRARMLAGRSVALSHRAFNHSHDMFTRMQFYNRWRLGRSRRQIHRPSSTPRRKRLLYRLRRSKAASTKAFSRRQARVSRNLFATSRRDRVQLSPGSSRSTMNPIEFGAAYPTRWARPLPMRRRCSRRRLGHIHDPR